MIDTDFNDQISEILENKIVLITGGTGSLGYVLTKRLLQQYRPQKIRILGRSIEKIDDTKFWLETDFSQKRIRDSVDFPIGDVRDAESVGRYIADANIIFHLAAMKDVGDCEKNRDEAYRVNVIGSGNVVSKALESDEVEYVIGASTDKACESGNQVYGNTKAKMEDIFINANHNARYQNKNAKFSLVRGGNFLGSRRSVLNKWLRNIKGGRPIDITDGKMRRFAILLTEAVDLYLWVLANTKGGEVITREMPVFTLENLVAAFCDKHRLSRNGDVRLIGMRDGERPHEYILSDVDVLFARAEPYPFEISYLERERQFQLIIYTQGVLSDEPASGLVIDTTNDGFLLSQAELSKMLTLAYEELPWLQMDQTT